MTNGISVSMTRRETLGGWIFLICHLVILPVILSFLNLLIPALTPAKVNFAYFIISFLAVILIFPDFLRRNWHSFQLHPGNIMGSAFGGLIVYQLCAMGIALLYFWIMPDFLNINDATISALARENYGMMILSCAFLVPVTEEVLYRGLIFRGFYGKSKLLAYALSTVIFAMIHISGYIGIYDAKLLICCFLQYIPAGLCLAWAYARADSIFAPILIHMAINVMGINALR